MLYRQCLLTEFEKWPSPKQTIAWIEERGAKVGAAVELKEWGNALFAVTHVYSQAMTSEQLKAKQERDRDFGGSIK